MSNFDHDRELPEPFDFDAQHDRYATDGFVPLSSLPAQDAPADTTGGVAWMPPSFDAAGFIADRHPNLIPLMRKLDDGCADALINLVFDAYQQGRMDNIGVVRSRFEKLAAMVRRGEPHGEATGTH